MCGINGFNFSDEELIRKMNIKIKHRGPDDDGIFVGKNWSLGHTRLSIIDLSNLGHQPMFDADKSLAIVFNGEIYNFKEIRDFLEKKGYKFKSKTDTEVILYSYKEWGEDCLQRFNGMFAFAILDIRKNELFLARDRAGIKPLYYYQKDNKFIFSSEIKAILEHGIEKKLSREAINIYFRLAYVPSPKTMWESIKKLPPAHTMTVDAKGTVVVKPYWNINLENEINENREVTKKRVRDLLVDSVKKELISDRPVGLFLSGGIDSTIIAGVMSSLGGRVKTFSAGFEETEESEKYNSDFYTARLTSKYFKTEHNELIIKGDDVVKNLHETIYMMDEPISNHIQTVNLLLSRFATNQVKVVLGGDGSDEIFGGYERYYYNYLLDRLQVIPKKIRASKSLEKLLQLGGKEELYSKLNIDPGVGRYLSFFAQKEKNINSFLLPGISNERYAVSHYGELFQNIYKKDFTKQFMLTDFLTWIPDESLARSDKMSMAAGLELRVPFLDHRLVELAFKIKTKNKIGRKQIINFSGSRRGYQGKVILVEAMRDFLPDFVLKQPKWGWFSPASKWLRGPMNEMAREVLSPSYCPDTKEYFNFDGIKTIFDDHVSKKQYSLNTIWSIITFQIWYKQFMSKDGLKN